MALLTVITSLQARHVQLSGVVSAPAAYPSSLNGAALPLVAVLPGEATWERVRLSGPALQTRQFIVRVFVRPVAQGIGVDTGFAEAVALLETFGDSYRGNASVGTGYGLLGPFTDSGHIIMSYAEVLYHGFEFKLSIKELA